MDSTSPVDRVNTVTELQGRDDDVISPGLVTTELTRADRGFAAPKRQNLHLPRLPTNCNSATLEFIVSPKAAIHITGATIVNQL